MEKSNPSRRVKYRSLSKNEQTPGPERSSSLDARRRAGLATVGYSKGKKDGLIKGGGKSLQ